jgi:predicted ATPase
MGHLIRFLAARHTVLILDNCEHVLDGVCDMVDAVLDGCPRITTLATSREALALPGEHAWRVPSLTVDGVGSSAVDLFVTRAIEADPGFNLTPDNSADVVEICRRLDGIPFALELAAARIRVMTAADIRRRLDDRFRLLTGGGRRTAQRQQTLQGTVEWSYDLLGDEESPR